MIDFTLMVTLEHSICCSHFVYSDISNVTVSMVHSVIAILHHTEILYERQPITVVLSNFDETSDILL